MRKKQTRMSSRTELRIVSVKKGAWRWQDAYSIVRYKMRRTRTGKLVWDSQGAIPGAEKLSMPQLRRHYPDYVDLPTGSLHNTEVYTK